MPVSVPVPIITHKQNKQKAVEGNYICIFIHGLTLRPKQNFHQLPLQHRSAYTQTFHKTPAALGLFTTQR